MATPAGGWLSLAMIVMHATAAGQINFGRKDLTMKIRLDMAEKLYSDTSETRFSTLGVRIPSITLFRFWSMLAHYHGQTWNAAEPARALGVSESTCRRYLDLLTDAMMVRQLQPLHSNIPKRQVKSPKIYIRDSGLLHQLLGIASDKDLFTHPKSGLNMPVPTILNKLSRKPISSG